jgi:hypothetical protein
MKKWIGVKEYADKIGRTRAMVYLNIRLGVIPKNKWKKIRMTELRDKILILEP